MNKRIQELKDQCYISIVDRTGDTEYDMEKFAQLLIRECAEICLEANDHKNILRYFGVEL